MLSRAIGDIYQLKRVHAILPDHNLGAALAERIQRLNLKPALATLPFVQVVDAGAAALSSSSSRGKSGSSSSSSSSPSSSGAALPLPSGIRQRHAGQQQLVFTTAAAAVSGRDALPEPAALCQLLECLAYFELARTEVTGDALVLLRATLPAMGGAALPRALAAVAALGQQDAAVPTLALLTAALRSTALDRSNGGEGKGSSSSSSSVQTANRTLSPATHLAAAEQPIDVITLMEALQAAEVHLEEVWALVAEHCVRTMDGFDGRELFRVLELFYLEDVTYYPDLFAAAEAHLGAQPYTFLSSDQRQQLVEYYKELGLPVASLLAASTSGLTDSFDAAMAAVPATTAGGTGEGGGSGGSQQQQQYSDSRPRFVRAGADTAANVDTAAAAGLPPLTASASSSAAMEAFADTAVKTIAKADEQELSDLMRKCASRGVMDPRVMAAAAVRLEWLCLPNSAATATEAPTGSALLLDIVRLTQILQSIFAFEDPHYFQAAPQTAAALSAVLNALAADPAFLELRSRLIPVALGAVTVLPPITATTPAEGAPSTFPGDFYAAVVRYIRESRDTLASEGPARLLPIASVLTALPTYGGRAVLAEYIPFIALSAGNAPMRIQVELAALLAGVPSARAEVLPAMYAAVAAQRGWTRRLSPAEAKTLLRSMVASRTRDPALVRGIMELVLSRRGSFEPADLVWFAHSLAVLGVRDLEFFSSTAEYLLSAVSPTTRARATVRDLCEVLYVFTFVIKGVIRVVQQVMARLKVSAGQASPRDVTLALFSFVRLQAARHHEVTGPLCDRAVAVLPAFRGEELASVLGSLRALGYHHEGLARAAAELAVKDAAARRHEASGGNDNTKKKGTAPVSDSDDRDSAAAVVVHVRLADAHFTAVVAALLSLARISAARRAENSKRGRLTAGAATTTAVATASSSAQLPLSMRDAVTPKETADGAATAALTRLFNEASGSRAGYALVCGAFRDASVRLFLRQGGGGASPDGTVEGSAPKPLQQAQTQAQARLTGVQVYLAITALAAMQATLDLPLSSAEWALLAATADGRAEQLSRGFADVDGCAAAEVLTALANLRADATVPALPGEEAALAAYVAAADRWSGGGSGTDTDAASPPAALVGLPPRLVAHVEACLASVAANGEVRDGLKRAGLLAALTSGAGSFIGLLDGATLSGSGGKARRSRAGSSTTTTASTSGSSARDQKRLTLESVMAAIDVEAGRRAAAHMDGVAETDLDSGGSSVRFMTSLSQKRPAVASSAASAAAAELHVWSPEVMLQDKQPQQVTPPPVSSPADDDDDNGDDLATEAGEEAVPPKAQKPAAKEVKARAAAIKKGAKKKKRRA